ncbi:MAG: hypothetical protein ACKVS9_12740 [Phycisphaerae bacterium]
MMLNRARKFVWLLSLAGMLAIGTGGLRALHHHRVASGDACATAATPHQHACDGDHQHVSVPAIPPLHHDSCRSGDEEHCVTCQLISVFSKVNVSYAAIVALAIERVVGERVIHLPNVAPSHQHFDPHIPRGPPTA